MLLVTLVKMAAERTPHHSVFSTLLGGFLVVTALGVAYGVVGQTFMMPFIISYMRSDFGKGDGKWARDLLSTLNFSSAFLNSTQEDSGNFTIANNGSVENATDYQQEDLESITIGIGSGENETNYQLALEPLLLASQLNLEDSKLVKYVLLLTQGLFLPLAGALVHLIGPSKCVFLGSLTFCSGYVLTMSFSLNSESLPLLSLTLGVIPGLGTGLSSLAVLATILKTFPNKMAPCVALAMLGFFVGLPLPYLVQRATLLNHAKTAALLFTVDESGYYTDPALLERLPLSMFYLVGVSGALQLLGHFLLIRDSEEVGKEGLVYEDSPKMAIGSPLSALACKEFYILWKTLAALSAIGLALVEHYQDYGQLFIQDSSFFQSLLLLGSVLSYLCLLIYAMFQYRLSFKSTALILSLTMTASVSTFFLTAFYGPLTFAVWTVVIFICLAILHLAVPVATINIFGQRLGGVVLGFLGTAYIPAAALLIKSDQLINIDMGWVIYLMSVGSSGIVVVLLNCLESHLSRTFRPFSDSFPEESLNRNFEKKMPPLASSMPTRTRQEEIFKPSFPVVPYHLHGKYAAPAPAPAPAPALRPVRSAALEKASAPPQLYPSLPRLQTELETPAFNPFYLSPGNQAPVGMSSSSVPCHGSELNGPQHIHNRRAPSEGDPLRQISAPAAFSKDKPTGLQGRSDHISRTPPVSSNLHQQFTQGSVNEPRIPPPLPKNFYESKTPWQPIDPFVPKQALEKDGLPGFESNSSNGYLKKAISNTSGLERQPSTEPLASSKAAVNRDTYNFSQSSEIPPTNTQAVMFNPYIDSVMDQNSSLFSNTMPSKDNLEHQSLNRSMHPAPPLASSINATTTISGPHPKTLEESSHREVSEKANDQVSKPAKSSVTTRVWTAITGQAKNIQPAAPPLPKDFYMKTGRKRDYKISNVPQAPPLPKDFFSGLKNSQFAAFSLIDSPSPPPLPASFLESMPKILSTKQRFGHSSSYTYGISARAIPAPPSLPKNFYAGFQPKMIKEIHSSWFPSNTSEKLEDAHFPSMSSNQHSSFPNTDGMKNIPQRWAECSPKNVSEMSRFSGFESNTSNGDPFSAFGPRMQSSTVPLASSKFPINQKIHEQAVPVFPMHLTEKDGSPSLNNATNGNPLKATSRPNTSGLRIQPSHVHLASSKATVNQEVDNFAQNLKHYPNMTHADKSNPHLDSAKDPNSSPHLAMQNQKKTKNKSLNNRMSSGPQPQPVSFFFLNLVPKSMQGTSNATNLQPGNIR